MLSRSKITNEKRGDLIMGRNDKCFCGSGKKYKNCHNDIHEESIAADVLRLYSSIDEDIKVNNKKKICQKGCSECCSDFFLISEAEFAVILSYFKSTYGNEMTNELIKKGIEFSKTFEKDEPEYFRQLTENMNTSKSLDSLNRLIINNIPEKQSLPCVFLNNENQCMIYDVRPVICRIHGIYLKSTDSKNVRVCSKIPTYESNISNMLYLDNYEEKMKELFQYKVENKNLVMIRREYPIFYYFKFYFDQNKDVEFYFNHPIISRILGQSKKTLFDLMCQVNK